MHHDVELDARGLRCPLPLLKARQALQQMASGQVLYLLTSDPGSEKDMANFARLSGHGLLATEQSEPGAFRFWLKKA